MTLEECMDIAADALKKQIPRKPIEKDLTDYWGYICDVGYHCPICDEIICFQYEFRHEEEHRYCEHCGQALDWSDDE